MKFELRLYREDKDQWAYADIEVDDEMLALVENKQEFMAKEIVPYIFAMQELT